jgi:hypothetical protein
MNKISMLYYLNIKTGEWIFLNLNINNKPIYPNPNINPFYPPPFSDAKQTKVGWTFSAYKYVFETPEEITWIENFLTLVEL